MVHLKVSGFTISVWIILLVSTLTGFVAGFLGVGGGFIRMPSLMYIIGCPTRVAVGTDLFEIVVTGAYGAFSYAMKGRVEIVAAAVMLIGAAIGAQFGTLATQYVKGLKIRLYFAVTMGLAGVSVIFKFIAGTYKAIYSSDLNAWVKSNAAFIEWAKTEGATLSSAKVQVRDWLLLNKSCRQRLVCPADGNNPAGQRSGKNVECLCRLPHARRCSGAQHPYHRENAARHQG